MMVTNGLAVLLSLALYFSVVHSSCYDEWSRCSPSTSGFNGILWKSCNNYCIDCFDADRGECYDSPSTSCPGLLPNNKQCRCINAKSSKKWWKPTCI